MPVTPTGQYTSTGTVTVPKGGAPTAFAHGLTLVAGDLPFVKVDFNVLDPSFTQDVQFNSVSATTVTLQNNSVGLDHSVQVTVQRVHSIQN
jgi:hypothetical protein